MDRCASWKCAWLQALVIVALGVAVGFLNNASAGSERRIAWVQAYPDAPPRQCTDDGVTGPAATGTLVPTGPAGGSGEACVTPKQDPETTDHVRMPEVPVGEPFAEINSLEALKLFRAGALFIDARLPDDFRSGHIQGAMSLPAWVGNPHQKILEIPYEVQEGLEAPLVVYCSGGDCEDSHMLARWIADAGFKRVFVYKDGYPDWLRCGRPVNEGDAR